MSVPFTRSPPGKFGDFLPRYEQSDGYSKTLKPHKKGQLQRLLQNWEQLQGSPAVRVVAVVLVLGLLLFTFSGKNGGSGGGAKETAQAGPSAASDEGWVDRREALELEQPDSLGGELEGRAAAAAQQQRRRAAEPPGTQAQQHALRPQQERFNQKLHEMYLDLPSLREPTEAILTVCCAGAAVVPVRWGPRALGPCYAAYPAAGRAGRGREVELRAGR